MKKVIGACAILAMLIFSSALFAGEVGEIHYGIKGGVGLAKAWGDDVPDEAAFKLGANRFGTRVEFTVGPPDVDAGDGERRYELT